MLKGAVLPEGRRAAGRLCSRAPPLRPAPAAPCAEQVGRGAALRAGLGALPLFVRGGARPGVGSVRGGPAGRRRLGWEQRGEPRAAVWELRAGPGAAGGCAGSEPAAGVWTSPPGCALGPGGPVGGPQPGRPLYN